MVLSAIVGSVGTGLLSTVGVDTSTLQWAAFMVVTGLGIGIGVQMPYSAVQVVLSETDVPIGNGKSHTPCAGWEPCLMRRQQLQYFSHSLAGKCTPFRQIGDNGLHTVSLTHFPT